MKNTIISLLFAALMFLTSPLYAMAVTDLYTATIPVADQSDNTRSAAVREGLLAVLVKLTGSRSLSQDPRVQAMLRQVNNYMVEYSFVTLPATEAQHGELGVRIEYDRAGVDRFVRTSKLPIWPVNRSPLLLWMVADDAEAGAPQVMDDKDTTVLISRALDRRGMPYVLPLYDLEDQMALTPTQISDFASEAIAAASERYPVESWLALRVYQNSAGEWRGAWLLNATEQPLLRQLQADTLEALLAEVVDQAVDSMVASHTYVAGVGDGGVELDVSGVRSYQDYSRLLALLGEQTMVRQLQVLSVDGEQLRLRLDIEGGREQLLDSLYREPSLEPLGQLATETVISDAELLAGAAILLQPAKGGVERLRWLPGR